MQVKLFIPRWNMSAKVRPELKVEDIVKLSKKGRKFSRNFSSNSTMIVIDIEGTSSEASCIVSCRIKVGSSFEEHRFYRSELWATGKNAFHDN